MTTKEVKARLHFQTLLICRLFLMFVGADDLVLPLPGQDMASHQQVKGRSSSKTRANQ